MKKLFYSFLLVWAQQAQAEANSANHEKKFCDSGTEFVETLQYLESLTELALTGPQRREKSLQIAKACDGAFDRFKKVYLVLTKSGVSVPKSFDIARDMSTLTSAQAGNFVEIFKAAFLESRLDLDFHSSLKLAQRLSIDSQDPNPLRLRKNLLSLIDFCQDEKQWGLSQKSCLDWSEKILPYQDLFPENNDLASSFKELAHFFENEIPERPTLKERLEISLKIMARGRMAVTSFQTSYLHLKKKSPEVSVNERLRLALQVADLALIQ